MKVLIVYEEVPEDTKFYAVEVTPDEWEWMRKTHRNYINGPMVDSAAQSACDQLSLWLEDREALKAAEPIDVRGFDYVLSTGFLL
jgi:hypothetical protein